MGTSDHTAEWRSLGIVFIILGATLAITVSLVVGMVMLVPGIIFMLSNRSSDSAAKPDGPP